MTPHKKVHELTPALAQILLAEKKALDLPNDPLRTELLYHIREVKYVLEKLDHELQLELLK